MQNERGSRLLRGRNDHLSWIVVVKSLNFMDCNKVGSPTSWLHKTLTLSPLGSCRGQDKSLKGSLDAPIVELVRLGSPIRVYRLPTSSAYLHWLGIQVRTRR